MSLTISNNIEKLINYNYLILMLFSIDLDSHGYDFRTSLTACLIICIRIDFCINVEKSYRMSLFLGRLFFKI